MATKNPTRESKIPASVYNGGDLMWGAGGVESCDRVKQPNRLWRDTNPWLGRSRRPHPPSGKGVPPGGGRAPARGGIRQPLPETAGVPEEQGAASLGSHPLLHKDDRGKVQEWIWGRRGLSLTQKALTEQKRIQRKPY